MVQQTRQKQLNDKPLSGDCVLYVMSRDQRVADNHALLAAQQTALQLKLPLAVVFCLLPSTGNRSQEQYRWMLQGLGEVEKNLNMLSIPFMALIGDPKQTLGGMIHHTNPAAIYFDFNPLRGPRALQKSIADQAQCAVYVVDTHNVIPAWELSNKQEYAARTIRPKVLAKIADYLIVPGQAIKHPYVWPGIVKDLSTLSELIDELLEKVPSNGQKLSLKSGEIAANKALKDFIANRLAGYHENRNDPSLDGVSGLSPYLHFGQLSSLRIAVEVESAVGEQPSLRLDADVFLEELIVRKELSDNFCYYNPMYDQLSGAAQWAQDTLAKHTADPREFIYSYKQFADAQTHDPAWNAAQKQLTVTGKMHGYMRMYWAKKVLEWSEDAQTAVGTLIKLNDFYSIDGGDPNGYVGILWSVAGVHDRPWFERDVYGSIRYMNYNGLKRKFNIEGYIQTHG